MHRHSDDERNYLKGSMEFAVAYKRIPQTAWVALKTNQQNVFFYDVKSKNTTWEVPAEVEEFVMNSFAPQDEQEPQEEKKDDRLESLQLLKKLIHDAGLSPFGEWELEKQKIRDESIKGLKLSNGEQRNVFLEYCKEKAQEEIQARAQGKESLKERFFALLESQNVSHQLTWNECQKRFKRHAEFMALPINERETIFQEWLILSKERAEKKKADLRKSLITDFYQLLQDVPQDSLVLGWKSTKKELEKLDLNFYKKFKSLDDKVELFLEWRENKGL